jgi:hypothetical protein
VTDANAAAEAAGAEVTSAAKAGADVTGAATSQNNPAPVMACGKCRGSERGTS